MLRQNYDWAIADYTRAIRLRPKNALAYANRGSACREKKDFDGAVADFTEAVRLMPDKIDHLTSLASLLATCPHDGLRDGSRAIKLALRACELSAWKDFASLHALAAAHAECGDFKQAITCEKRATAVSALNSACLEEGRRRLKLYEQGKPDRAK